jgi:hypothetical protein
MPSGHIVRWLGGRRRVLSAINAETARPQWPDVRLRRSAYVMSHKPRGSIGSLSEWGAWCKPRTRASTGPLPGRGPGIPCPRILGPGGDLSRPPHGRVWDLSRRSARYARGPVLSTWQARTYCVYPEHAFSLGHWRPQGG